MKDFSAYLIYKLERKEINISNEKYPSKYEKAIHFAYLDHKESKYESACEMYYHLIILNGTIYIELVWFIFKSLLCAGEIFQALIFLEIGKDIFHGAPKPRDPNWTIDNRTVIKGHLNLFEIHSLEIAHWIRNKDETNLCGKLKNFSDNPNYLCPLNLIKNLEEKVSRN